jgi:hypothetical protein
VGGAVENEVRVWRREDWRTLWTDWSGDVDGAEVIVLALRSTVQVS